MMVRSLLALALLIGVSSIRNSEEHLEVALGGHLTDTLKLNAELKNADFVSQDAPTPSDANGAESKALLEPVAAALAEAPRPDWNPSQSWKASRPSLADWVLKETDHPLACDVPLCDRSDSCDGNSCCNTQMFEAVSAVADWMESKGMNYTLLFGTLLGAYRDNDVIPWTSDIDLGVYRKDVPKLIEQTDIPWNFGFKQSLGNPRGCEYHHPGFPGRYSGHAELNNEAAFDSDPIKHSYYIDLYVLDFPPDLGEHSSYGGRETRKCLAASWGEDGILQTTTVKIRGKEFRSPLHIEDCLVAEYGENWKIPDAEHSWHR